MHMSLVESKQAHVDDSDDTNIPFRDVIAKHQMFFILCDVYDTWTPFKTTSFVNGKEISFSKVNDDLRNETIKFYVETKFDKNNAHNQQLNKHNTLLIFRKNKHCFECICNETKYKDCHLMCDIQCTFKTMKDSFQSKQISHLFLRLCPGLSYIAQRVSVRPWFMNSLLYSHEMRQCHALLLNCENGSLPNQVIGTIFSYLGNVSDKHTLGGYISPILSSNTKHVTWKKTQNFVFDFYLKEDICLKGIEIVANWNWSNVAIFGGELKYFQRYNFINYRFSRNNRMYHGDKNNKQRKNIYTKYLLIPDMNANGIDLEKHTKYSLQLSLCVMQEIGLDSYFQHSSLTKKEKLDYKDGIQFNNVGIFERISIKKKFHDKRTNLPKTDCQWFPIVNLVVDSHMN